MITKLGDSELEILKSKYFTNCKVVLLNNLSSYYKHDMMRVMSSEMAKGLKGNVILVDDRGDAHVKWQNGIISVMRNPDNLIMPIGSMKFNDLLEQGLTQEDELYEFMSEWHEADTELSYYDYLGLTVKEYDEILNKGIANDLAVTSSARVVSGTLYLISATTSYRSEFIEVSNYSQLVDYLMENWFGAPAIVDEIKTNGRKPKVVLSGKHDYKMLWKEKYKHLY